MGNLKFLLVLLLAGCTILTDPPVKPVNLSRVEITHCKLGFLKTGWACSEIRNQPAWLHPLVIQVMGCAVKYYDEAGLSHAVIFADYDWVYEHEIGHLQGWDDGTEVFLSQEEAAHIDSVTRSLLENNKEACGY